MEPHLGKGSIRLLEFLLSYDSFRLHDASASRRSQNHLAQVVSLLSLWARRPLSRKLLTVNNVRWLFHIACTLYFARVLTWHISPESAGRQGRKHFGGYFRFLTVNVLSVQVLQLAAATLVDMTPKAPSHQLPNCQLHFQGIRMKLKRNADDLSCSVFVLATGVTILFYVIEFLQPGGILASSSTIVPWINYSTHILNSVVAWTDIAISHPRRFSKRSFNMTVTLGGLYGVWISFIKHKTGKFPYGFMNQIPHPYGLIAMAPVAAGLAACLFSFGKKLSRWTQHVMRPQIVENLDVDDRPKGNTFVDQDEVNALKIQ